MSYYSKGRLEVHRTFLPINHSKSPSMKGFLSQHNPKLKFIPIFRVDEAKNSEMEASNKWQQERRQVAHMEKQLSRVQSGQGVVKGRGKGYGTGSAVQTEDVDELTTR